MKHSAGVMVIKNVRGAGKMMVLLGHPGGPFYHKKDEGVWSMPKGCFEPTQESPMEAALREFHEETGVGLGSPQMAKMDILPGKHKTLYPFVVNFDNLPKDIQVRLDATHKMECNTCEIEYRGRLITIPEVDKFRWFGFDEAYHYIAPRQSSVLDTILDAVANLT